MDEDLILEAAQLAAPREACGVVVGGRTVQIANIATELGKFEMDPTELFHAVKSYGDIEAVWHSHPNGRIGPSKQDLKYHPPGVRMIIATLTEVNDYGVPEPQAASLVPQGAGTMGSGDAYSPSAVSGED